MARYVDGYVLPLPKKNLAAYRRMAKAASKVWMDHGALQYCEAVGEDFPGMCGTPFPKLARCKKGETVVFAWVVYKSRKQRDQVNAKVMSDPRLAKMMNTKPPFDMTRMSFAGFDILVEG